jgi:hypothetical protein
MGAPFRSYLDGHVPVVQATGFSPGKRNWTVLSIYHDPTDALPYQAEVVGDTIVENQVIRLKRARFRTLAEALGYQAFDRASPLYEELRCKAVVWLEQGCARDLQNLTCVQIVGPLDEEAKTALLNIKGERFVLTSGPDIEFCRPAMLRTGFDGADGLHGALPWLYQSVAPCARLETLAELFAEDFGLDVNDVDAMLQEEQRCGGLSDPMDKAFLASLRFFDREAFVANRVAG